MSTNTDMTNLRDLGRRWRDEKLTPRMDNDDYVAACARKQCGHELLLVLDQAERAIAAERKEQIEACEQRLAESQAEVARLRAALGFYADERRYRGPNQSAFAGDEFTTDGGPYMVDVTRDWGRIARAALEPAR